jgi:hypothetical protein
VICSDPQDGINTLSRVAKPEKADAEAGREFIEGIRKGLEDYVEGRYKVFKDADELLDDLLSQ